ncbi:MAG: hypothetical protein RL113_148 [Pseudomonadota bacterium]|jgi:5-formyltetrahydrofolate cyclo-ligase
MTKAEKKDRFRQESLQKLNHISKMNGYLKDKKIVQTLYWIIAQEDAKSVMLYLPLSIEVNLYPLILKLRKERRNLYVPFMEGKSFRLVKYRLPLRKKQFGIKEPNDSKQYRTKKIDMAIVPIVGVDGMQRRIGFGKGMYDRFFEKERHNIQKTIFTARKLCYAAEDITDAYDVRADMIITA